MCNNAYCSARPVKCNQISIRMRPKFSFIKKNKQWICTSINVSRSLAKCEINLTHETKDFVDGRHFPDDIFKCIFLNENVSISLEILQKFVPKIWINYIPSLVQIMSWRRSGDKPLSEPMMVSLLTHICVTRPQWVNRRADSIMRLSECKLKTLVRKVLTSQTALVFISS